jgi:hypothetical protein
MTMPHLMNCLHSEDGWCLDCVKELWEQKQRETERIEFLATCDDGWPVVEFFDRTGTDIYWELTGVMPDDWEPENWKPKNPEEVGQMAEAFRRVVNEAMKARNQ